MIRIIAESVALASGVLIGFAVTEVILGEKKKSEEIKTIIEIKDEKAATISGILKEPSGVDYVPTDFQDLVDHLRDKYMLLDLTISTSEGLLVASNSQSAEEDAATSPEILRMLGGMLDSDVITISGKDEKIIVFRVDPEIIAYARVKRDIAAVEIERMKEEIIRFMEGYL